MRRIAAATAVLLAGLLAVAASSGAFRGAPPAKLVWADEFNGPAGSSPNPSNWTYAIGGNGWGGHELETYTSRPQNAALDGSGHLVITARREEYTGPDGHLRSFTSARLETIGRFSFRYGTVAARIKVPAGRGLWPAFWMLGANADKVGLPAAGEIDTMEVLGNDPRRLYGTVHGPGPSGTTTAFGGRREAPHSLAAGFHVYAVRWTPQTIEFTVDRQRYGTVRRAALPKQDPWVFDRPMFLLLNLAVGGDWPGSPTAATPFPAQMVVDWVRVWKPA